MPVRIYAFVLMFAICLPGYLISAYIFSKLSFISKRELPYFSLLLSPILVSLFTLPILFLGIDAAIPGIVIQVILAICILASHKNHALLKQLLKIDHRLAIVVILVLIMTAIFISGPVLPLFTDSIHHYSDINAFVNTASSLPLNRFYHYGYHLFIAQVHHLTGINISDLMLASGVNILALCAVGVYTLALVMTEDYSIAAICSCVVSLTGVFPSFAQNWGKYPAMFSLSMMPFMFSLIVKYFKSNWKLDRLTGFLVLAGSTLMVVFGHLRSIFFIIAFVLAGLVSSLVNKREKYHVVSVGLSTVLSGLTMFEVTKLNISIPNKLLYIAILLSAIFFSMNSAKKRTTNRILFPLLFFGLTYLTTKIPLPVRWIQHSSLIDWTYYRIALFIPAGIFIAIILSEISSYFSVSLENRSLFWIILAASLFLVPWKKKLFPNENYVIVEKEQMQALNWIADNYAETEIIFLVAGQSLPDFVDVSDSGGWIEPLTGHQVEVLPTLIDFSITGQRDLLCQTKPLIFIDNTNILFDFDDSNVDPNLYDTVYHLDPVWIISPICNE